MRLILGSKSPRRKKLLETVGIHPVVVPSNIDEDLVSLKMPPKDAVIFLARKKVYKVVKLYPDDVVLAADTVVVLDGKILGKPKDLETAKTMLRLLSGKTHKVYTGVALYEPKTGHTITDVDCTYVTMKKLDEDEIEWYIKTKEPLDKAGSYALQGLGALFVSKIEGDYTSVIGLPLPKVYEMLKKAKIDFKEFNN